jgi:hypothetical protein
VSILEIELAGPLVVFLVECTAGGEDSNSHAMFASLGHGLPPANQKLKRLRNKTARLNSAVTRVKERPGFPSFCEQVVGTHVDGGRGFTAITTNS